MDPKELVRSGYDVISPVYRADDAEDGQQGAWLEELAIHLPPGASVLDLGCGCGVPAARWLVAHGHQVTGVDISPIQIERARRLVPRATFRCSDVTELDFPDDSFDAIVSFFAIIHVPVEEQPALFQRIGRWLRPDGWFMATLGTQHWTGTEENWLSAGAPMYWSHADADTYRQWIREAGLLAELERFIPEETGGHNLILAHKPHSREPA